LAVASDVVKSRGYVLESLQYNNAIFIRADAANGRFEDMSCESAYDSGYRNRPDRAKLFPWNSDVDAMLGCPTQEAIDLLNERFEKYRGKYTLR
jgi:hypothetical protein